MADYGIIIAKGITHLAKLVEILEENKEKLTPRSLAIFLQLNEQFNSYTLQLNEYHKQIECIVKQDVKCKAIMEIEGIGPITASAIVATIGDPSVFKNGREVAAWLELTPKQHSSGNTIKLSGISKRGDRYVRTLLIHGARTALKYCDNKTDGKSLWMADKKRRCGYNKAAVALANKNARVIWAILTTGECYRHSMSREQHVA